MKGCVLRLVGLFSVISVVAAGRSPHLPLGGKGVICRGRGNQVSEPSGEQFCPTILVANQSNQSYSTLIETGGVPLLEGAESEAGCIGHPPVRSGVASPVPRGASRGSSGPLMRAPSTVGASSRGVPSWGRARRLSFAVECRTGPAGRRGTVGAGTSSAAGPAPRALGLSDGVALVSAPTSRVQHPVRSRCGALPVTTLCRTVLQWVTRDSCE